jgi:zinc transporter ZupT
MSAIDDVLVACLLANIAGLGAAAFVLLRPNARPSGPRLLSFALGVLVGTVLLDLLPHLWEATGSVITVTALFAVALSASWWFDRVCPCVGHRHAADPGGVGHATRDAGSDPTRRGVLLWVGDFAHSVVDGAVIGGALALGVVPGSVATMAVAIHEVPRRIAVVTLLVRAGHRPLSALLITVGTGAGTMVGGALVWRFAPAMSMVMPVVLAVAASAMLYVALSHSANLFGAAWRQRLARERAVPFAAGLLMIQLSHQAHELLG